MLKYNDILINYFSKNSNSLSMTGSLFPNTQSILFLTFQNIQFESINKFFDYFYIEF